MTSIPGDPYIRGDVSFFGTGANTLVGNLISGSTNGVVLYGQAGGTTRGVQIQGNLIGTNKNGDPVLGNGVGVLLAAGSVNCIVGGSAAGAGNVIAGNTSVGVEFGGMGGTVFGNSIYGNGIGIDFNGGGGLLNDSAGHTGANHYQNFPVLSYLTPAAGGVAVTGSLTQAVTPNTAFRIEFFANTDPGHIGSDRFIYGYGEAKRYLGSVDVTTDGSGTAAFSASFPALLDGEHFVTATATNLATGDTSEFSRAIALPTNPPAGSVPAVTISEFDVPGGPSVIPASIARGPDGNMWVVDAVGGSGYASIQRVTPDGQVTQFQVPGSYGPITAGPDGNLWILTGNRITVLSTAGAVLRQYPPPDAGEYNLAFGPDGSLWVGSISVSNQAEMVRMSQDGQVVARYVVPLLRTCQRPDRQHRGRPGRNGVVHFR